jgi:hypothetical protein
MALIFVCDRYFALDESLVLDMFVTTGNPYI